MSFPTRTVLAVLVLAAGAGGYVYLYGWPAGVPTFGIGGGQAEEREEKPPVQVVLADVGQADVRITVEAIGDTVARESVILTSRVSGRVQAIGFTDGQAVRTGDVLVQLDPADAEVSVQGAAAGAEEAAQAYQRAAQLAQSGSGPQSVADDLLRQAQVAQSEVESARERLDDYNIRVPFNGRLGLRNISLGTFIQPGVEIATLDAVDPIEIRFTVPERYLGQIAKGAAVKATTPAFPDDTFTGEVTAIASRVDPALRTVTLEASVPNADGRILPGMLMNVTLDIGMREDAVVAPPLAVQLQGATHFVFRIADGKAERAEVQVGQRTADQIEITEGLKPGERVIVEGFQDLASGQAVEEKQPPARAQADPPEPPAAPAQPEG